MSTSFVNGTSNPRKINSYTITGLKRWSCIAKDLPSISQVKAIHVYDFDNTLFSSPLPNHKLWNQRTVGLLQTQEGLGSGGWWHDSRVLEATGEGAAKEEPKAWKGWWNETIVELVKLSIEQGEALTILLTGRGETNFANLIKRIVKSKDLSFDMICLKPETGPHNQRFSSTMNFKQAILQDLIFTYREADEIKVYEDRPKHTRGFREFFQQFNLDLQYSTAPDARKPINATVVQVADQSASLDPVTEIAEIQRLVNDHNSTVTQSNKMLEIKRQVFYTGYLINPADTTKLLGLVNNLPNMNSNDVKFLAANILITHGSAQPEVLTKVGGIGHKQTWQVIGLGVYSNSIWAARVTAVPPTSIVHTDSNIPLIILAHSKNTPLSNANRIFQWQPVPADKQYVIQTTVGEKVQLKIEPESDESEPDASSNRNRLKRRRSPHQGPQVGGYRNGHAGEESKRQNAMQPTSRAGNQPRNRTQANGSGGGANNSRGGQSSNPRSGRGGPGNRSGGGGGGSGSGHGNRNRGGPGGGGARGYKSLDDVGNGGGRYNPQRGEPNYDDYVPPGTGGSRAYDAAFPPLGGDAGLPYGK